MFLWSINIFNNSSFNTFPGISQNLPENVSIFFAKMIDLCLLTQKNQTLEGVIGRNIALWQNLWVGVGRFERRSSSARASLALSGRFNQFRSPYSWITMRRALRKRRVFDFVPSYLKACPAILDRWFWVLALPLVVAPPNLQNQLTLTSEGAWNYHGFDRSLQNASVGGEGLEKCNPGKSVCHWERLDH